MTDIRQTTTNYVHPTDPNLLNIHKAMEFDGQGRPVVRTVINTSTVEITGPVNILSTVTVNSTPENPVHVHLTEVGNYGTLTNFVPVQGVVTATQGTTPWVITGTVAVSNFTSTVYQGTIPWATTVTNWPALQVIGGTVYAVQSGTWSVGVTGTVTVSNFTSTVQVSNNVTATITGSVTVNNTVTISDGGGSITVDGTITTVPSNTTATLVKYIDSTNTQMDAVDRLRVSGTAQNYWYTPSVDKDGDLRYIESFTGTGATSVFVQNIASILMTSGTDNTGSAIRISRHRHKTRPGISMFWMATGAFNGLETNVVKRRGCFTGYNGVFFEASDDLYFVVRRRLVDGTLVEDRHAHSTWSIDKLDGTGASGINVTALSTFTLGSYVSKTTKTISATETHYNVVFNTATRCPYTLGTKATVTGFTGSGSSGYNSVVMIAAVTDSTVTVTYPLDPGTFTAGGTGIATQTGLHMEYSWWIDFDGSKTNKIRFGIYTESGPTVCGIVDYTGLLGTQWANAPAMSDRLEITNTGAVTIRPTMTWSSTSINTEAEAELNPCFGAAIAGVEVTFNKNTDVGHEYAIVGIALRAGEPYQRSDLQIQRIQCTDGGNLNPQNAAIFQWRLVLNPTLGGTAAPAEVAIGKTTRMWDYDTGTTVSGGITLMAGYFQGTQSVDVQTALNFLNLGSNIAYDDSDRVVLVLKMLTAGSSNSLMYGTINFIEAL